MVLFYVTGHGFGHASRVIEVINALLSRAPGVAVHVRTACPRWLFDLTVRGQVQFHPAEVDTGVVQFDSLRPDIARTIERAAAFYAALDVRARQEARFVEAVGAHLVVADLPPIAFPAADLAGVPSVAFGNFTWDWIYEGYAPWLGSAGWLPGTLREAQSTSLEAWRLPMHGGFASHPRVVDVPFVCRRARGSRDATRHALGIGGDDRVALVSFGGFGLEGLPLEEVAAGARFTVVTTDVPAPDGDGHTHGAGSLTRRTAAGVVVIDEHTLYASGLRYEDVVAAADVVVTKPGYGIIAECIANGAAMLYTSRGAFAEYDVLVREMPRYLRTGYIDHPDLIAGRWTSHLESLLAQPEPPERPRVDGADVVADRILALLR